jgi:hypothetical protein
MMSICPLPVDWLDYLDGERPDLKAHLDDCLACEAIAASLRSQPVNSLVNSYVDTSWVQDYFGRTEAVWNEDRPAAPAAAEFWFSSSDFTFAAPTNTVSTWPSYSYEGVDRLLLLVVSNPNTNHDMQWLDVVPVLSDVERAGETDVLFNAYENSLGAPWRALFAHQCKVAREQLDTRVGSLGEAGQIVLTAAFAGELDERRWGPPLQHPGDPRAFLDADLEEGLARLRTPWLLMTEMAEDGSEQAGGPHLVPAYSVTEEAEAHPDNLFSLRPLFESPRELALAAASSSAPLKELWVLDSPRLKLKGKLHVDFATGLLSFVVMSVQPKEAKTVRLHLVAFGDKHESPPFAPVAGTAVALADQVPIDAVESLVAEVLS